MSEEDLDLIVFADATKNDANKKVTLSEDIDENVANSNGNCRKDDEKEARRPLLKRLPSIKTVLRPRMKKLRRGLRQINCFKSESEEHAPMMESHRHRSIDIGIGLFRRASLFIFQRRIMNVHPYHPYTPEQSTRKIYLSPTDK
ncbi:hypothetical protein EVAR_20054_1 [Eumeta japonica]|uniref:Uncharacterized protein n=1 Tax=Eumeta variegata TaxID=151549 RepID=A0A4C1UIQ5_EUMVA|nr:hypothetical protein EVAR_20054_1 [Eumeta japonica]